MTTRLIWLLSTVPLIAQSQNSNLSGSCDQVINDNRGVITITCSGVDKSLMEQLKKTGEVLDRIAHRQADPAILSGLKDLNLKMDEVLSDTRELKATAIQNDRKIAISQQEMVATKKYFYVSTLSFNGTPYSKQGDIKFSNEISQAIEGTWFESTPDHFRPVCTTEVLQKDRDAIRLFPDFPFTYYALAFCQQVAGASDWRSIAEQAVAIFEQTTSIGGHNQNHDQCLAYLRQILAQPK
jgi:hypothetical protein